MLYLLLALTCSASIVLIFKHSETNDMNRYGITTVNYITAFTVSLITLFMEKTLVLRFNFGNMLNDFKELSEGSVTKLSIDGSILLALVLGVVVGVLFYVCFILYQKCVKNYGASMTGMFGKLGILVPMLTAIIVWKELPTELQALGIILSLVSILIVNINLKEKAFILKGNLLLLFAVGGMAEFANKLFQKYTIDGYKSLFLFVVFFTAFLFSVHKTLKVKKKVHIHDVKVGVMVGIPNLFSSFFLIKALSELSTPVVFSVYSAGSMILILLGSRIIFNETLKRKEWISIVMTIVALVLINI